MEIIELQQMINKIKVNEKGAIKFENGWTYSEEFMHFQKVNNLVYVYVTPQFGRWITQLYLRKTTSLCTLEARADNEVNQILELFEVAEYWLTRYGNDTSGLIDDYFHISQNGTPTHKDYFHIRNFENMAEYLENR